MHQEQYWNNWNFFKFRLKVNKEVIYSSSYNIRPLSKAGQKPVTLCSRIWADLTFRDQMY